MDGLTASFTRRVVELAVIINVSLFGFAACAQDSSSLPTPVDVGSVSEEERAQILEKYNHLDPEHLLPTKPFADALVFFDKNQSMIRNKNYMAVIDFSKNSAEKRFYIVNMENGTVWTVHVAHGRGSDPNHDGMAKSFSNENGSNKSSLGFYLTDETYSGDHGLSLRLDGLSSTNSKARSRAIVIHGADYVREADVIQGRSLGCPAVDMRIRDQVIRVLKEGSLIYAVK